MPPVSLDVLLLELDPPEDELEDEPVAFGPDWLQAKATHALTYAVISRLVRFIATLLKVRPHPAIATRPRH